MTKQEFNFEELFTTATQGLDYWVERVKIEFAEDMVKRMDKQGLSRADLARAMDSKPSYVTKILRGTTNFTLESMVKIARALGSRLCVHLEPEGATVRWFDVYGAKDDELEEDISIEEVQSEYHSVCRLSEEEEVETLTSAA